MADQATLDMISMAQSYDPPAEKDQLMQDNHELAKSSGANAETPAGTSGSMRDFLSKEQDAPIINNEPIAESSEADVEAQVMASRQLESTNAVSNNVGDLNEGNEERHARLISSLTEQTKHLGAMSASMQQLYDLLYKEHNKLDFGGFSTDKSKTYSESVGTEPGDGDGTKDGLISGVVGSIATLMGGKWALNKWRNRGKSVPDGQGGMTTEPAKKRGWFGRQKDKLRGIDPENPDGPRKATKFNKVTGKVSSAVQKSRYGKYLKPVAAVVGGVGAVGLMDVGSDMLQGSGEHMDTHRGRYREERAEISRRTREGEKPLEGEELIEFRTSVTEKNGFIANPFTGYALNPTQQLGVESGLFSARDAATTDNQVIYQRVVEENAARKASGKETIDIPRHAQTFTKDNVTKERESKEDGFGLMDMAVLGGGAYLATKVVSKLQGGAKVDSVSTSTVTPATSSGAAVAAKPQSATQLSTSLEKSAKSAADKQNSFAHAADDAQKSAAKRGPNFSTLKSGASTLGKGLKRSLPILGVALTAHEAYSISQDDTQTAHEKGASYSGLAGAASGAVAGGAAGAAIGSVVPVVGTVIGGVVGSVAGAIVGEEGMKRAYDWFTSDDPEIKDQRDSALNWVARPIGSAAEALTSWWKKDKDKEEEKSATQVAKEPQSVTPNAIKSDLTEEIKQGLGIAMPMGATALPKQVNEGIKSSVPVSLRKPGTDANSLMAKQTEQSALKSDLARSINDSVGKAVVGTAAVVGKTTQASIEKTVDKTGSSRVSISNAEELANAIQKAFDSNTPRKGASPAVKEVGKSGTAIGATLSSGLVSTSEGVKNIADVNVDSSALNVGVKDWYKDTYLTNVVTTPADPVVRAVDRAAHGTTDPQNFNKDENVLDNWNSRTLAQATPRNFAQNAFSDVSHIGNVSTVTPANSPTMEYGGSHPTSASDFASSASPIARSSQLPVVDDYYSAALDRSAGSMSNTGPSVYSVGASPADMRETRYEFKSSETVNDVKPARETATQVQKVMMIDNNVKASRKQTKEEAFGAARIPSRSGTQLSDSIHSRIDDTPSVVTDHGLALLSTGYI